MGMKTYRKQAPVGSPYTRLAQVLVAAARKWRVDATQAECNMCYSEEVEEEGPDVENNENKRRKARLGRTTRFRAAIIDAPCTATSPQGHNPWRLCTVNQVEEVKLVLRLIPIWLSCIMFTVVLSQNHTLYVKQASTMQRSFISHNFIVPPASLQSLIGLTIIITVPFYDRIFVPFVRRHITGHPSGITLLQRIGTGLALSILEAAVAALVESRRLRVAKHYGLLDGPKGAVVPMQVWWLVPQYAISGMSDAFTIVGLQELFYDQMPESMRSMGAAAYISIVGIGSFVNTGVITVVQGVSSRAGGGKWLGDNLNRANLDKFYWILAGMSAVNFCVYLLIARGFVYRTVEEHDVRRLERRGGGAGGRS
ncbi:unnamed protein product [Linum tenue]|uniref:Uncharacterized protein n=1 Tax=Linum tenue TaxID=586396 RepID=A0AAV0NTJ6_9ROSI|nr:unnamed protein product [Linum tenue]